LNRDSEIATPTYAPDILTNYELGWKTTLLDGRLRFNGAVYFIEWEDMQYTIYEFVLSPVGNTYNIGEAEITGVEADFSYLVSERFTLSGAIAYNDAETTEDFVLESGTLSVPSGTELPNIPEFKYNLTARYEFMLASYDSYAQLAYSYTDESYNQIRPSRRVLQDDFSRLNFRTGFNTGAWGVDFYVNNLTDENDNISVGQRPFQSSATTQRPRTVGVKFSMRFE
jgi:outer membrane receptor protein involved in Fe transport